MVSFPWLPASFLKHAVDDTNLNGNSFANVMQIDIDYAIISNLDMRLSYKRNNSVSSFDGISKTLPLHPEERGLINLTYKTISDKWHFDFTANYIGKSRIPDNIVANANFSSPFPLIVISRSCNAFSINI